MSEILKPISKALVLVQVRVDDDCDISDGEYSKEIIGLFGSIDTQLDIDLINECVDEWVADNGPAKETWTNLYLAESGEREDVFWNKYFIVAGSETEQYA